MLLVFKVLILFSSIMVFLSANPVHSVLFLICVFVSGSGLILLLGFQFLSMILLVVYVGAIAVLFLFIVMMMNLRTVELRQSLLDYYPFGLIMLSILFLQLGYTFDFMWFIGTDYVDWGVVLFQESNLIQLGQVLYTYLFLPFILSSYLLLVAMIGAIYLTYVKKERLKKQSIYLQVSRRKRDSLLYWSSEKD